VFSLLTLFFFCRVSPSAFFVLCSPCASYSPHSSSFYARFFCFVARISPGHSLLPLFSPPSVAFSFSGCFHHFFFHLFEAFPLRPFTFLYRGRRFFLWTLPHLPLRSRLPSSIGRNSLAFPFIPLGLFASLLFLQPCFLSFSENRPRSLFFPFFPLACAKGFGALLFAICL